MDALAKDGFKTITVSALATAQMEGVAIPDRTVVLTFDDGFLDFVDEALPVLESYGFTATLYVTTGYVGRTSEWLAPEGEAQRRMLGWADLEAVVSAGIEIGAHTATHPQLDLVTTSALVGELTRPKVELEDRLGTPITSLAYPFGYSSRRVRRLTAQLGYDNACIVSDLVSDRGNDPFAIPRLTVTQENRGTEFLSMLSGATDLRGRVRAQAKRTASHTLRRFGVKKRASVAYSRSLR